MIKEESITKKRRIPLLLVICAAVVLFLGIAVILIMVALFITASPKRKLQQQLDFGEKYITDFDYDNALLAYEKAIEIDPNSVEAYIGYADVRIKIAEEDILEGQYIEAVNNYDDALVVLQKGQNNTNSPEIANKIVEIEELIDILQEQLSNTVGDDTDSNDMEISLQAGHGKDNPSSEESINVDSDLSNASVGDIVYFGSYEQDYDKEGPEPIEWRVLDDDESGLLLISEYVIDEQRYHDEDSYELEITWEDSYIRKWLNDDFINSAFNEEERSHIRNTSLSNPSSYDYYTSVNATNDRYEYGADGGNDTIDKVFLLSYEELFKYFGEGTLLYHEMDDDWIWYAGRVSKDYMTMAVPACSELNMTLDYDYYENCLQEYGWPSDCVGVNSAPWWLRSPGQEGRNAMLVDYDGGITVLYSSGGYPAFRKYGIRPAMWVEK